MLLYVGCHSGGVVRGEPEDLTGRRVVTAAYPPKNIDAGQAAETVAILDSAAFTDERKRRPRLTAEEALARQLSWEERARRLWGAPEWQAEALVSYDVVMRPAWLTRTRQVRAGCLPDTERAVAETVESAAYLASQRERLRPRKLILTCQGGDAVQYVECARSVLKFATPEDWLGLGGFAPLGLHKGWLAAFHETLWGVLPEAAASGLRRVHLFGVLYEPALAGLLWLADHYGLEVSTDSTAPIMACTYPDPKKAGVRAEVVGGKVDWRENVRLWQEFTASLRTSAFYRPPPRGEWKRQESFFREEGRAA